MRRFGRDVELAKAMGFNGVRKHQKIEDPRYLYWADRLGLLVWEEMPSAYRFTDRSIQRVSREWIAAIERDTSHPCIVAWVPINESWGVPNLPTNPAERHYVHGLYHLTKTLDPTRPVIGNDGWESVATDIIGIHDYDGDPGASAERYRADEMLPRLFKRERPGGRLLVLEGETAHEQPVMLTEFGGITLSKDEEAWGYSRVQSQHEFEKRYTELLRVVTSLSLLRDSATRNSLTPIRRRTACCTPIAHRSSRSNGLRAPPPVARCSTILTRTSAAIPILHSRRTSWSRRTIRQKTIRIDMFRQTLIKPDGRRLELYSRRAIPPGLMAPSPEQSRTPAQSAYAMASAASRVDRICGLSTGPHVSSTARIQPAGADD